MSRNRSVTGQDSGGTGDPQLEDPVVRAATLAGLDLHPAAGLVMMRTAPFRLLESVADWLDEPRFAHLATLARHPDVEAWLLAQGGQSADV